MNAIHSESIWRNHMKFGEKTSIFILSVKVKKEYLFRKRSLCITHQRIFSKTIQLHDLHSNITIEKIQMAINIERYDIMQPSTYFSNIDNYSSNTNIGFIWIQLYGSLFRTEMIRANIEFRSLARCTPVRWLVSLTSSFLYVLWTRIIPRG